MSLPPQAPGPINRGISAKVAIFSRRPSQSVGALVTSADPKSGPAASRKDCGWLSMGGRTSAVERPGQWRRHRQYRPGKNSAITSRISIINGQDFDSCTHHEKGQNAAVPYHITKPLRRPARRLTLRAAGEGRRPKSLNNCAWCRKFIAKLQRGERHVWPDAGLAFAVSSHH